MISFSPTRFDCQESMMGRQDAENFDQTAILLTPYEFTIPSRSALFTVKRTVPSNAYEQHNRVLIVKVQHDVCPCRVN
jgi:hypothetical protein